MQGNLGVVEGMLGKNERVNLILVENTIKLHTQRTTTPGRRTSFGSTFGRSWEKEKVGEKAGKKQRVFNKVRGSEREERSSLACASLKI